MASLWISGYLLHLRCCNAANRANHAPADSKDGKEGKESVTCAALELELDRARTGLRTDKVHYVHAHVNVGGGFRGTAARYMSHDLFWSRNSPDRLRVLIPEWTTELLQEHGTRIVCDVSIEIE